MRRNIGLCLLLTLLYACQSRENLDEVESGAAAAASTENQVATYARRVKRAEAKLEDYDRLAAGIETRLKTKRGEVRELRAEVGRRAQEVQGLKKEAQTLNAEASAQKEKLTALKATIASERGLVEAAQVELRTLEDERRQWRIELEEARRIHGELADYITPILARLPSFEPEPETQPAPAEKGEVLAEQPAEPDPAKDEKKPATAPAKGPEATEPKAN